MRCDKCGKEMTEEATDTTVAMLEVTISHGPEGDCSRDFMQKQVGKYELGKTYRFCCECYLDMCFLGKYGEAPKVFLLTSDDWEGIYVDGDLVYESHNITPMQLLEFATKLHFSSEDVKDAYIDDIDDEIAQRTGCFPKKLSDLKGDYK